MFWNVNKLSGNFSSVFRFFLKLNGNLWNLELRWKGKQFMFLGKKLKQQNSKALNIQSKLAVHSKNILVNFNQNGVKF
jgi:hypothetical protein